MNTRRPEPKPHYPRPNTSDEAMLPRDLALLNELHDLRVAAERIARELALHLPLIADCPAFDPTEFNE